MNLHEMAAEIVKTASDQVGNGEDGDTFRQKPLLPVPQILTDYISEVAFVNRIQFLQLIGCWPFGFISINDCDLIF